MVLYLLREVCERKKNRTITSRLLHWSQKSVGSFLLFFQLLCQKLKYMAWNVSEVIKHVVNKARKETIMLKLYGLAQRYHYCAPPLVSKAYSGHTPSKSPAHFIPHYNLKVKASLLFLINLNSLWKCSQWSDVFSAVVISPTIQQQLSMVWVWRQHPSTYPPPEWFTMTSDKRTPRLFDSSHAGRERIDWTHSEER